MTDPDAPLNQFDLTPNTRARLAKLLREAWNDAEIVRLATAGAFRLRNRENRARRWVSFTVHGDVPPVLNQVWCLEIQFKPPTCTPVAAGLTFLWQEPSE